MLRCDSTISIGLVAATESLVYALYVGETTTSTQTAPNQMKMNAVIINLSDWNIWLFRSGSSAAWLLCHYVYHAALYVHVTARSIFDANISIWLNVIGWTIWRWYHTYFGCGKKRHRIFDLCQQQFDNERKTKQTTTPTAKWKTINWNRCWKSFWW